MEKSVILFTSATCKPCKVVKEFFDNLAQSHDRVKGWHWLEKRVEGCPEAISVYNIKSVPTILVVVDKVIKAFIPAKMMQNQRDLGLYIEGKCLEIDNKK